MAPLVGLTVSLVRPAASGTLTAWRRCTQHGRPAPRRRRVIGAGWNSGCWHRADGRSGGVRGWSPAASPPPARWSQASEESTRSRVLLVLSRTAPSWFAAAPARLAIRSISSRGPAPELVARDAAVTVRCASASGWRSRPRWPVFGRPGRGGIAAFSQPWSVRRGQCLADSSPMGLHSASAQPWASATRTPYPRTAASRCRRPRCS
jgi:hypothetical protein